MTEEWRFIHPDYEVSNLGRVRSYAKRSGRSWYATPHLVALFPNWQGYPQVKMAGRTYRVHTLVAKAFIGPCPPGHEVLHADDNPANACLDNLSYGTPKQNIEDCIRRGRYNTTTRGARGEQNSNAKLNDEKVREIRKLLLQGVFQKDIGAIYGVKQNVISKICTNKTWRHVV